MDARRGLTGSEADERLRELFLAAGPEQAPDDLEQRVLHRLERSTTVVASLDKPIISRAAWSVMALGALGAGAYLWTSGANTTGTGWSDQLRDMVPEFSLTSLFTSPWLLAATGGAMVLFALDTLLTRPRLSAQPH